MPGWDDPRYVAQQVKALQKKVAELERKTLPFALQQKGALPGSMRAVAINDQGQANSMWINFGNLGPGSGPYWAVTDANKVIRVEGGNLAANGVSPAQEGLRVNNASAAPIFDSLGLISVGQQLVNIPATSAFSSNSTTPVTVTGTSASFSLTRALRLLFFWAAACSYGAPNTQTAFVDLVLDSTDLSNGVSSPAMQLQYPTTTTGAVTSMGLYSASVASGSHTVNLAAFQNGTQSFTLQFATLLVFQLGS